MDDYAEFSLGSAAEDKVYSAVTENIAEYWVAYSTHIGTRKYQQDAVKIPDKNKQKESKNICVLSDGMGGMQGGEIASNLTVNTLFDDFYNQKVENCPAFFSEEIKKVDALVKQLNPELHLYRLLLTEIICIGHRWAIAGYILSEAMK